MSDRRVDLYAVLGLSRNASGEEIRSTYRRLALENHPDHHSGDERKAERFRQVAAAYAVLGDPQQRAAYNRELEREEASAAALEANRRAEAARKTTLVPVPMPVRSPQIDWITALASVLKIGVGIWGLASAVENRGTRWDSNVQRRRGRDGRFRPGSRR